MATTTEATTPRNESYHSADHTPRTPTSLPSIAHSTYTLTKDSRLSPQIAKSLPIGRSSPSPKTPRQALSPRSSPQTLTGAAALADARRVEQEKARQETRLTSPNPNAVALRALMSSTGMSRASDAPPTSRVSEPMQRAAEKITTAREGTSQEQQQAAAHSTKSSNTTDSMTATASGRDGAPQLVEEPESMDNEPPQGQDNSYRPFTYPGPLSASQREEASSRRDMSLPNAGYEQSPKSSSTKRHKCPYCSTDFTRHHNLKSHLLTHSQEKPYVCQTCQARFRRLHDLKRHAKLHTGERPHTCDKCGRRFARGDALARHNKGPGGCAGRRSSFGGDDDGEGGDDAMDGLEYQDDGSDERGDNEMLDASGRRVSEPMSRKRPHPDSASYDSARSSYRQHSSTYPPPAGPGRMVMGPPQGAMIAGGSAAEHSTAPTTADSSYSSQIYAPPAASGYPSVAITESPQPLSPANANQHQQRLSISEQAGLRNRSPSLTQPYQQTHQPYARSHPPPQPHLSSHPPQLPSLSGLAQGLPQPRGLPIQNQSMPTQTMMQHQPPPQVQHPTSGHASGSNSHSSHGHSSGGSIRDFVGQDPQEMWNYIRSLEQRFSRMQDEYELRIGRLQSDVISLKNQVTGSR